MPNDIAVTDCKYVDDDFHARYSSTRKEYVYCIYNSKTPSPFLADRSLHINRSLNVELMNIFAKDLVGTNDYVAFSSSGRTVKDTVRTIYSSEVTKSDDVITVRISADGFLYNMVRIIVGTLIDVSDGKIDVNSAKAIIDSKERSMAGFTAAPQGLFLNRVYY